MTLSIGCSLRANKKEEVWREMDVVEFSVHLVHLYCCYYKWLTKGVLSVAIGLH